MTDVTPEPRCPELRWKVEVRTRQRRAATPAHPATIHAARDFLVLKLKTDHSRDGWIAEGTITRGPVDKFGRPTDVFMPFAEPAFIAPTHDDAQSWAPPGRAQAMLIAAAAQRWAATVYADGFMVAQVTGEGVQQYTPEFGRSSADVGAKTPHQIAEEKVAVAPRKSRNSRKRSAA